MKKLLLFVAIIFSTNAFAVEFKGKFLQGHFIIGITEPGSKIIVGKKEVKVSEDGYFVFGIDRDRKFDVTITKIFEGKKEKIIKKVLLLLHPIAPFVSEEIWNHLKDTNEEDIIISSWPKAKNSNISHDKDEILDFKEIVTSIRIIRYELNVPPSKKIDVIAHAKNESI